MKYTRLSIIWSVRKRERGWLRERKWYWTLSAWAAATTRPRRLLLLLPTLRHFFVPFETAERHKRSSHQLKLLSGIRGSSNSGTTRSRRTMLAVLCTRRAVSVAKTHHIKDGNVNHKFRTMSFCSFVISAK